MGERVGKGRSRLGHVGKRKEGRGKRWERGRRKDAPECSPVSAPGESRVFPASLGDIGSSELPPRALRSGSDSVEPKLYPVLTISAAKKRRRLLDPQMGVNRSERDGAFLEF